MSHHQGRIGANPGGIVMSTVTVASEAIATGRALFTADEVADALAISTRLVRQLTTQGDLPCRRIGRLVRYAQGDIDAFVATREAHPYR